MRIETLLVDTVDGLALEGDLALPASPIGAVAVAHPHPQFGGDRHSPVVDAVFRSLAADGFAALRIDFRGVGRSEGSYGDGVDERMDVAAALDAVSAFAPDGPLVAVGYSFGALVSLQVVDPRMAAWVAIAPPLGTLTAPPLAASDHRPKLVLAPAHDQFTSPDTMRELTADWSNTTVEVVEMADHFLGGRLGPVALDVVAFVNRLVEP